MKGPSGDGASRLRQRVPVAAIGVETVIFALGDETAFALTVHKSQGSEFAHTLLVLPEQDNPVLTRELLYTGITRAREQLDLFATPEVLALMVRKQTERYSGLVTMLETMRALHDAE